MNLILQSMGGRGWSIEEKEEGKGNLKGRETGLLIAVVSAVQLKKGLKGEEGGGFVSPKMKKN